MGVLWPFHCIIPFSLAGRRTMHTIACAQFIKSFEKKRKYNFDVDATCHIHVTVNKTVCLFGASDAIFVFALSLSLTNVFSQCKTSKPNGKRRKTLDPNEKKSANENEITV